MTKDKITKLTDKLGSLHYRTKVSNPSRDEMDRATILEAIDAITTFSIREQQMANDVKELQALRVASKAQKALIADLEQKLSGREDTTPTVAAGALQRGVEAEAAEG